jgi:hypothetical protein
LGFHEKFSPSVRLLQTGSPRKKQAGASTQGRALPGKDKRGQRAQPGVKPVASQGDGGRGKLELHGLHHNEGGAPA